MNNTLFIFFNPKSNNSSLSEESIEDKSKSIADTLKHESIEISVNSQLYLDSILEQVRLGNIDNEYILLYIWDTKNQWFDLFFVNPDGTFELISKDNIL